MEETKVIDPKCCKHEIDKTQRLWAGKIVLCTLCHCRLSLNGKGKVNKSKKQRLKERRAENGKL